MVGSPEDGLQLRLRLSLVLGQTRPIACGIAPFALSSPDRTTASDVALVIIVPNIREGVVFAIKWSPRT
jgi:hypothetical protein